MKMNHEIAMAMHNHGGQFVKNLAACWVVADPENRQRIELTWPELVKKYAAFLPENQTEETP